MARGFAEILATLKRNQVELIVVGGGAAVLQGVPITTIDIDIVHRRTEETRLAWQPRSRNWAPCTGTIRVGSARGRVI